VAEAPACVVFGGGGHARVLIDALLASGAGRPVAIVDPAPIGREVLGVPVIGGEEAPLPREATHFVMGLGSTRDNGPRRRLFENAVARGLRPLTVVHPGALVSRFARVGPGCAILAQAVVNAGATLCVNVIVNTGAIVEHDCIVGDHAHVATGACLAGTVTVGEEAHVGAGAVVRQGARIGAGAVIGAGAAVIKDVPAGVVVAGVPARPLKP
jgi:sugar O-acyltransferase (sialic acid O-acetyltransferase NeuD family)